MVNSNLKHVEYKMITPSLTLTFNRVSLHSGTYWYNDVTKCDAMLIFSHVVHNTLNFLCLGHPTYWRVSGLHHDLCHTLHHHHGLCHQHSPPLLVHASRHGTLGPPCLPAQSSEAALHAQPCRPLCNNRRESPSWRNSSAKLWGGLKTRQQPSAKLCSTQTSSSTGLYSIHHAPCGKGEWSQRGKKNGSQWVCPSGE